MSNPWPPVPLGEILTPVSRPEPIDPQKTYRILGAHWYAEGLYTKDVKTGAEIRADKLFRVEKGDFVYNRLFAWKGSFAVATQENHGCYVSNEFPCFLVNHERDDGLYLWRYFSRPLAWDEALGLSKGGTPTSRNRLKEENFLTMKIPLPSLPEQRRIVARIEELAANVKEALDLRRQVEEEAKRVFSGARSEVFKLKEGWQEKSLDEIAPVNMGQSPPGESYNDMGDGVPLLNGPTEFGERYPSAVQWTITPTKLCGKGDILLCVRGATTGRMNWADKEYCIGRGLAALKANTKVCMPEYVYHFVETQTQEMLSLSAGSTFPNLPGAKLKTMRIPIPSLPEQCRIVAYLDELQAKADALKQIQAETAAGLDALLPAVLDRAFRGELLDEET